MSVAPLGVNHQELYDNATQSVSVPSQKSSFASQYMHSVCMDHVRLKYIAVQNFWTNSIPKELCIILQGTTQNLVRHFRPTGSDIDCDLCVCRRFSSAK